MQCKMTLFAVPTFLRGSRTRLFCNSLSFNEIRIWLVRGPLSQPSPPDSSQLLGMTMQENAQNDNAPVVLATDTYFPGDPINPVADTAGNPHIYLPTSAFIYLSSSTADRNKLQSIV